VNVGETRYAQSGDVSIAFRVGGDGPYDIVYVPGFVSNVELIWDNTAIGEMLRGLATFARVIVFDKRGTGMSDRVAGIAPLETRMDDVRAVMDAVGSARAAVVGLSEGAPMSLLFAATYPERTAALVLVGGFARTAWAPDYPSGLTEAQQREEEEVDLRIWTAPQEEAAAIVAPVLARGVDPLELVAFFRQSASPGAVRALNAMNAEIDVRHALSAIGVPTLLFHGTDDPSVPIEAGRDLARRIPGARLVELAGERHIPRGPALQVLLDETQRFLGGAFASGAWDEPEPDRVLATILFTDIVDSTATSVELGDRRWRALLERHNDLVRGQLVRFRGRELDTAGDGFFATFDGPARAIRCACAVTQQLRDELGLDVRAGLHSGECELLGDKVAGVAVSIGARVASRAGPGEVLVSSTVKDLVAGSGISFADRGVAELKGVPGEWRLYAVEAA
jgi:pimeloyl-ACP methyl ester carboxylesterase